MPGSARVTGNESAVAAPFAAASARNGHSSVRAGGADRDERGGDREQQRRSRRPARAGATRGRRAAPPAARAGTPGRTRAARSGRGRTPGGGCRRPASRSRPRSSGCRGPSRARRTRTPRSRARAARAAAARSAGDASITRFSQARALARRGEPRAVRRAFPDGAQANTSPRSSEAASTAAARECTPSFFSTLFAWLFTVSGERNSASAISRVRGAAADQVEHLPLAIGERALDRPGAAAALRASCAGARRARRSARAR